MSIQPTLRRLARSSPSNNHKPQTSSANHQSQIFHLPDGRVLGYAEYGNPNGKPLLYFHGYPSSRIEAEPADALARRFGIRLLSLDRPGFGLSTPLPGRKISDWSSDVRAFASGLGLGRFAIMGLSGGGPFALACAHELPRSMVSGVGLFASAPPWVAGPRHMSLMRRWMSVMANYWPGRLGALLSLSVWALRAIVSSGSVVRWIDGWIEAQDKKKAEKEKEDADIDHTGSNGEKQTKTIEQRRNFLLDLLINEPFAQGVSATVLEAKLLSSQDWGFKFEDVAFGPVRIWHGSKDGNAPIGMIRYMAERLPHADLREYKNDTHYTMFARLEEALETLSKDYDDLKA